MSKGAKQPVLSFIDQSSRQTCPLFALLLGSVQPEALIIQQPDRLHMQFCGTILSLNSVLNPLLRLNSDSQFWDAFVGPNLERDCFFNLGAGKSTVRRGE